MNNPSTSPVTQDKILFLDLDGVLHSHDAGYLDSNNIVRGDVFIWVNLLSQVLDSFPEVRIVISSTWRLIMPLSTIVGYFPENLRAKIIDVTSRSRWERYDAIKEYVAKYKVRNYVILDDAKAEFPGNLPELVWCHSTLGISEARVLEELRSHLEKISAA